MCSPNCRYGMGGRYCIACRRIRRASSNDIFPARSIMTPTAALRASCTRIRQSSWVSLDQPTAETLGYAQVTAFKQMDRLAIMDSFLMHERFVHFHRLVSYWSQVLYRLQPDLLLMPTAPHQMSTTTSHISSARLRGIRCVMFEYVTTEGWSMAIERLRTGCRRLPGRTGDCLRIACRTDRTVRENGKNTSAVCRTDTASRFRKPRKISSSGPRSFAMRKPRRRGKRRWRALKRRRLNDNQGAINAGQDRIAGKGPEATRSNFGC